MNETQLGERIARVRTRVERAAERSGRDAAAVRVLPITKGHSAGVLRAVAEAGFAAIGENRVGEAERKREALGTLGLCWHMVGHLQRNKAARAVALFDVIESVDSRRLARRLSLEAERAGREPLPVLVQVNASGEEAKGGFPVDSAPAEVARVCELPGLAVRGLMTMAPFTGDEDVLRATFRRTAECFRRCREEIFGHDASVLSMGMSNDFEIAIEEGSTEVRLGTILVGERPER
ncbi:MAG: YggS family pyridoxal phosphate-dependent enzyme [Gemmatimonadota bacterium]|nr:YggS family pyridoxal phosphate-dependent enzyme [Gemmatimonadota bacterium]